MEAGFVFVVLLVFIGGGLVSWILTSHFRRLETEIELKNRQLNEQRKKIEDLSREVHRRRRRIQRLNFRNVLIFAIVSAIFQAQTDDVWLSILVGLIIMAASQMVFGSHQDYDEVNLE